jgi:hypothetical protein
VIQSTERFVEFVFLVVSDLLLRLGRCTSTSASGPLRGRSVVFALVGSVLRPFAEFVDPVFDLADAVGDLDLVNASCANAISLRAMQATITATTILFAITSPQTPA